MGATPVRIKSETVERMRQWASREFKVPEDSIIRGVTTDVMVARLLDIAEKKKQ